MAWAALPINASSGSPAYTAQDFRTALSVLTAPSGTARPLGARSGRRVGSNALNVTVASWPTISIAPGSAVLDVESPVATGPYYVSNNATDTSLTGTVAGGTDRQDGVFVRLSDTDVDASGLRKAEPIYIQGTASPPATPARHLRLAVITVPHSGGGAPSVAMDQVYTVAAGGTLPVLNSSVYPASPYDGMPIYDMALNCMLIYNGSDWIPVGPVVSSTGTLLVGTFDPEKPVQRLYRRQSGTSDSNGLFVVSLGVSASAILWAQGVLGADNSLRCAWRNDLITSSTVTFQGRDFVTGAAQPNQTATLTAIVDYQV